MDEITFEYFLENPRGRCLEKHVASKFPELYKKIKVKDEDPQKNQRNKYSPKKYTYISKVLESVWFVVDQQCSNQLWKDIVNAVVRSVL